MTNSHDAPYESVVIAHHAGRLVAHANTFAHASVLWIDLGCRAHVEPGEMAANGGDPAEVPAGVELDSNHLSVSEDDPTHGGLRAYVHPESTQLDRHSIEQLAEAPAQIAQLLPPTRSCLCPLLEAPVHPGRRDIRRR